MRDPRAEPWLDEYRDAIASLHVDGAHVAYLATKVEPMRAGLLLRRAVRVWFLLTRLDGSREPIQEDYDPWVYIPELGEGGITWASQGGDVDYDVTWLQGDERRDAWVRYGIIDDVGAYMGGVEQEP